MLGVVSEAAFQALGPQALTFQALAEPRRRDILRVVRDQPRSVNEIAAKFDITQQAVSQHLKVLKGGGPGGGTATGPAACT
jgi:DNA-binding MarR family transcriptional regulator